ncbi:G-protein coupled receptor daf-37-like [Babylonia areolata]|uniref:G-protein coupled receptor daf-37-like n=1 Tax=Babylonia areolata TaxID=304850 RepID=UPI003FD04B08
MGGFGNIATIFVMRRIKDHNSSQHALLMALAVSDFCLLYTGVLRMWIVFVFEVDVLVSHAVVCKAQKWLVYSVNTLSAWLVTSVTVQRTMAVLWPHRMRAVCTVRRTWLVIAALVFTVFALYSHLVVGVDVVEAWKNECNIHPDMFEHFYRHVFTWLDMCSSSFLPFLCLLTCNVILSLTLFRSSSFSSSSSMAVQTISSPNAEHSKDLRKKTASRTTVLVLVLSCTFLALTMPVCAFLTWYHHSYDVLNQSPRIYARAELALAVTFQLWYTNSAINFLLYCLTGTKFRREFLSWIRCGAHNGGKTSAVLSSGQERN